MSQEVLMELLSSLREAQSQWASAPACHTKREFHGTPLTSHDNSDRQLSHSDLTTAPSHDARILSFPTLIKSTVAPTKTFTEDIPYQDNLSLGMIFTMAAIGQAFHPTTVINQADNPFEPRPIHPSMENKSDSRQVRSTCHRRLSVQHIIEILNDIQPLDDDQNVFHPSMLPSCEGNVADDFSRPEDNNICCTDMNQDKSASWLSGVIESSETVTSSVMNPNNHSSRHVESQSDSSKEHCTPTPLVDKLVEGEIELEHLPPLPHLLRMRRLMSQSRHSQSRLEEWDTKNGLPRSHCCTMVHTNRSRKQLEEGRILPKWNGAPLIRKEGVAERKNHRQSKKVKRDHAGEKP